MNPIEISQKLQQTLVRYLTTTFDVNRDGNEPELASMIRSNLNAPGALFNGPFLELTPPYKTGRTLDAFIEAGTLSSRLRELPCFQQGRPIPLDAPLYTHQESSIIRLIENQRSIVVSSGTGSGKTECFLIPILNNLLMDDSPGVRALLVYPMNALVNDQLDRLRGLLAGTTITFGRYTSELEQTERQAREKLGVEPLANEVICRDDIQSGKRIPQILITNYAMLEYLLLRPEDSKLFQSGAWRYVVLDEAHTYAGAQGVEVAMLMRRLKHRLNKQPGDMRCIATSATLTDNEADKAAAFAVNLFHEDVTPEDVIFGEIDPGFAPVVAAYADVDPEAYLHEDFDRLLEVMRSQESDDVEQAALHLHNIGLIGDDKLELVDRSNHNGATFLWYAIQDNPHLIRLRDWMLEHTGKPVRPIDAAKFVFGADFSDEDSRLHALYHLIELGAIARSQPDQPPLLPARYHLFARPPQGVWACINPECPGRETSTEAGWSRLFSRRVERCDACGCQVYPITVCRECGQTYLHLSELHRELTPAQDGDRWSDRESRYFTWRSVKENYGLGREIDEDEQPSNESSKLSQEEIGICVNCGQYEPTCRCDAPRIVRLWQVTEYQEKKKGKQLLRKNQPVTFMNQCPRCYSTAQRNTEIVTPMTIAGTTPLATITYEMYRYLPASPKADIAAKPGSGRKLLTFYDSRQGAARFAAFLQDTVNQQNYRHIIPAAVHSLQTQEAERPDFEELSRRCVDLAWDYGIFHNDPDTEEWRKKTERLSRAQRKRLMYKTSAEILAEFTTRRNERQSLETLGLIAVEYFEDVQEALEFVSPLAEQIRFSPDQALALVNYLLDDLRKKKVVVLPEGVERDDPVFGRNTFSPRLVRGGQVGSHEEAWIGKTERKVRRRLMKKMLSHAGQSDSQINIECTLGLIFDWLIQESDLLDGAPADGWQLREDRLFFNAHADWYRCDTCLRLSARGDSLPCSHPDCTGTMHPFDTSTMQNFYFDLFRREIVPLRVEEHTAQLDAVKGRSYQDGFRDGDINILSCSTTFEMGIDLGDLQAVAMSNVPPTVANYRQRAGRAGRRSSGAALILTWASDRPHDQTYFRDPSEIIQGQVRVPHIALDNTFIRRRHINAILLSEFLRYRHQAGHDDLRRVGTFFDEQVTNEPHFTTVEGWLNNHEQQIRVMLADFGLLVVKTGSVEDIFNEWIEVFRTQLQEADRHYQDISGFYIRQIEVAQKNRKPGDINANRVAREQEEFYEKLLKRLRDEYLINHLSDRGFLPSYSFPLYSVELLLPPNRDTEHLRLQRDLRQAIREYAPGSEIVADKRIWRSAGIQFYRETPRTQEYQICHNCGHLRISTDPGKPLPETNGECEICGVPYNSTSKRVRSFLTPDGFRADWKNSGQPAKQYVISNRGSERSALIPPSVQNEQQFGNSMLFYDYQRDGELLYVNEGRSGKGYKICFDCGSVLSEKDQTCKATRNGHKCPGSRMEIVALGHVQKTDTLHLRFVSKPHAVVPAPDNLSFWLSVMYALIQGASRALQIERRDIDGVLYPRQSANGQWEQSIVLYDDVPGGAGHVRQIVNEFPLVIREALVVLNCTDCDPDTSCSHCLCDYSNQYFWDLLKRHEALRFLESLQADLFTDPSQTGDVVALNLPHWLMRQVENTHSEVWLAADSISLSSPFGTSRTWLDVLNDLRQRDVDITLLLGQSAVSHHDSEGLSIAQHLRLLMDRGLRLHWINNLPEWQVVIDPEDAAYCRAIQALDGGAFRLDNHTGSTGLKTTIQPNAVFVARNSMHAIQYETATEAGLTPPANVRVINIQAEQRNVTERLLFGDLFATPVRALSINDPYLVDAERILNRLGAYIDLARLHGTLENITIYTKRAGQRGMPGSAVEQDRHFDRLAKRAGCTLDPIYDPKKVEHDRSITLERTDGTQARILIGRGLDFIRPDGSVDPTYIVIQDPLA